MDSREVLVNELRTKVLSRLSELGFRKLPDGRLEPPSESKDVLRNLQRKIVEKNIQAQKDWIQKNLHKYLRYLADGVDIIPEKVSPFLVEVKDSFQAGLFRLATLTWSVPLALGIGKRIRYLIIDTSNGKLMGIVSLMSPMIDMPARDSFLKLHNCDKTIIVNKMLEANIIGAVPPYNMLLGGKLAALSVVSNEIRDIYVHKYGGELIAITTMSALGRSSIYNRLKYHDIKIAEKIGYSGGHGIFHLEEFYEDFCQLIEAFGKKPYGRMQNIPSWRIKNIRRALKLLGLPPTLTHHGIRREVYLFRIIDNLEEYVTKCSDATPIYRNMPFKALADYWKERYMLPRAARTTEWKSFRRDNIISMIYTTLLN